MMTKLTEHSRHTWWRLALILLLVLPFLPELVTIASSTLAAIRGCNVDGKTVCVIGPLSLSRVITSALEAGAIVSAGFGLGFAAVWLALCFVTISLGWRGATCRLLLAFAASLFFAFLPYLAPMLAIRNLENPNCRLNEGGVGFCVIYGGDIGAVAYDAVTAPGFILLGVPIALGAFIIYVAIIIRAIAKGRVSAPAR
jgi:hypothetical protein